MAKARRIRSRIEQDPRQLLKPGGGCLMQRRVPSGLLHVDVRSLVDQQTHSLGNSGLRQCMHAAAGCAWGCERSGAHARRGLAAEPLPGVRQTRLPGEEAPSRRLSSHEPAWRSCRNSDSMRRQSPSAQASKISRVARWVSRKSLISGWPVVNAPQKSRDALGVSASNQRRIFFRGGGKEHKKPAPSLRMSGVSED